jgi:hypothetical protein
LFGWEIRHTRSLESNATVDRHLGLVLAVLFLHDKDRRPGLEEVVPTDLSHQAGEKSVRFREGATEAGRGQAEESDVGLCGAEGTVQRGLITLRTGVETHFIIPSGILIEDVGGRYKSFNRQMGTSGRRHAVQVTAEKRNLE